MNKQELIDKLRPAIAEEFELEEEKLALDAPIKETLDLDSLSLVDLIALIEGRGEDIPKQSMIDVELVNTGNIPFVPQS